MFTRACKWVRARNITEKVRHFFILWTVRLQLVHSNSRVTCVCVSDESKRNKGFNLTI